MPHSGWRRFRASFHLPAGVRGAIERDLARARLNQRQIARRRGVSNSTVSLIARELDQREFLLAGGTLAQWRASVRRVRRAWRCPTCHVRLRVAPCPECGMLNAECGMKKPPPRPC